MVSFMGATDEQIAAIEARFAERMGDTGIRLPAGVAQRREPGHIFEKGWHIGYVWGEEVGEEYIELLVQGVAIDDVHVRWWASGREEELPTPDEWVMIPPDGSSEELARETSAAAKKNQSVYDELRERGLLPPAGDNFPLMEMNEFLNSGGMAEASAGAADTPTTEGDTAMLRWIVQAAAALQGSDVPPLELREHHLAAAIKDAINETVPAIAASKVLGVDAWPSLGRSATDVVVLSEPAAGPPRIVAELKWCQMGEDKVHEAIWDLFKVALLVDQYGAEGYLVTAAPVDIWPTALCGELFSTGTFVSEDLFARTFPNGRPVWDWLLQGGRERFPEEVPEETSIVEVARAPVSFGTVAWEIRAVRVSPSAGRLQLQDGWPYGDRPAGAKHPSTGVE
jgi:hypothetical protein